MIRLFIKKNQIIRKKRREHCIFALIVNLKTLKVELFEGIIQKNSCTIYSYSLPQHASYKILSPRINIARFISLFNFWPSKRVRKWANKILNYYVLFLTHGKNTKLWIQSIKSRKLLQTKTCFCCWAASLSPWGGHWATIKSCSPYFSPPYSSTSDNIRMILTNLNHWNCHSPAACHPDCLPPFSLPTWGVATLLLILD